MERIQIFGVQANSHFRPFRLFNFGGRMGCDDQKKMFCDEISGETKVKRLKHSKYHVESNYVCNLTLGSCYIEMSFYISYCVFPIDLI